MLKAEGIIFRSFKYSETSFIIDVFTRQEGVLSFIISGIRKKNATISAAMLQVMNIVDIVATESKSNKLGRIVEIKSHFVYRELLYDFIKSSIGVFMIELSRNCIKEKEANYLVYDFIKSQLIYLDSKNTIFGIYPLNFLIKLSKYLGFYPQDNYSTRFCLFDWRAGSFVEETKENKYTLEFQSSHYIQQLLKISSLDFENLDIPKSERQVLINVMLLYYQYHIESFKPLKSLDILEEIMKE